MMNSAEVVLGQILTAMIHDMVSDSIWGPSGDVISSHHHDLDRALKSPSINKNVAFNFWHGLRAFQNLQGSYQTQ